MAVREIERIACVGAGLIGQGWATVFASRGYPVVLQDVTEEILDKALGRIEENIRFLEAHRMVPEGTTLPAMGRIRATTHLEEAVGQADYVQESVPDRYESKKPLFQEMDRISPAHALLASSSSGLLMTEIQKETSGPGRCVMAHPILPVYLVPLVEVAGGEKTSPDAALAVCELMKRIGKTPVLLNREVSGFIVNRLQAALFREAIDLVDKGVASAEDVDKAFCTGMGLRDPVIGPLLRAHLAGDGIDRFLKDYAESYRIRWESLECWTSVPLSAAQRVIEGVNAMTLLRTKGLEEIKTWRDEMLVRIIEAVQGKRGE